MSSNEHWDGAFHEAFRFDSVLEQIEKKTGVRSRILLRDAPDDESPVLIPGSHESDDRRYQVLGVSWDSRPEAEGGQGWFHLYPDEAIPAGDELHWTGPNQNWNFMCAAYDARHLCRAGVVRGVPQGATRGLGRIAPRSRDGGGERRHRAR